MLSILYANPLTTSILHHIETSHLICRANQSTVLYMMGTVFKNGQNKFIENSSWKIWDASNFLNAVFHKFTCFILEYFDPYMIVSRSSVHDYISACMYELSLQFIQVISSITTGEMEPFSKSRNHCKKFLHLKINLDVTFHETLYGSS